METEVDAEVEEEKGWRQSPKDGGGETKPKKGDQKRTRWGD